MARAYLRILGTILLAYAVIIGLNEASAGGPGRLLLLGYVLGEAVGLGGPGQPGTRRRWLIWIGTAIVVVTVVVVGAVASAAVASGVVGGLSLVVTASVIAVVGRAVVRRRELDTPTVVGVLAVYLLLALLFASLNQLFAAFEPHGYLNGVTGLPTASDQLYFSVITMATVGFGDITPGSQVARAVAVVEALTGQLYLVSVVAAVVGGWQRPGRH
jgi:hypothetical protein